MIVTSTMNKLFYCDSSCYEHQQFKKSIASQQVKLGLVLEDKLAAPSIMKPDSRVEFGLGF